VKLRQGTGDAPCGAAAAAALLALLTALPGRAQAPAPAAPRDWDTVSSNMLLLLLVQGYIEPAVQPGRKEVSICVIGDSRFGNALQSLATGKKVALPQPVPVRAWQLAETDLVAKQKELLASDVIVFATDDANVHAQVITAVGGRPVLLCSRMPGFLAIGGHLQLWLSNESKARFELADKVLVARGLKVNIAAVKASKQAPPPAPKSKEDK
jgi:hypothetical protein